MGLIRQGVGPSDISSVGRRLRLGNVGADFLQHALLGRRELAAGDGLEVGIGRCQQATGIFAIVLLLLFAHRRREFR